MGFFAERVAYAAYGKIQFGKHSGEKNKIMLRCETIFSLDAAQSEWVSIYCKQFRIVKFCRRCFWQGFSGLGAVAFVLLFVLAKPVLTRFIDREPR
jgi:hypothetical protein